MCCFIDFQFSIWTEIVRNYLNYFKKTVKFYEKASFPLIESRGNYNKFKKTLASLVMVE